MVKGAVTGGVLAYRGGTALANTIQESRRHAGFQDVAQATSSASSAHDALTSLATTATLEVPLSKSRTLAARLQELVTKNDKAGIAAVGHELVAARQNRLQAQIVPIIAESCRAIGFSAMQTIF